MIVSDLIFFTNEHFSDFCGTIVLVDWIKPKEGFQMQSNEKVAALAENFSSCTKILAAMGDETRQHLILKMLQTGSCDGLRVCEITEKTNLSRPAVSHHLQIMKDAGIVKIRKEGTKNYYYFDPEMAAFEKLISTLQLAMEISKSLPDRSRDDF